MLRQIEVIFNNIIKIINNKDLMLDVKIQSIRITQREKIKNIINMVNLVIYSVIFRDTVMTRR